jgi:hypothetical protein
MEEIDAGGENETIRYIKRAVRSKETLPWAVVGGPSGTRRKLEPEAADEVTSNEIESFSK